MLLEGKLEEQSQRHQHFIANIPDSPKVWERIRMHKSRSHRKAFCTPTVWLRLLRQTPSIQWWGSSKQGCRCDRGIRLLLTGEALGVWFLRPVLHYHAQEAWTETQASPWWEPHAAPHTRVGLLEFHLILLSLSFLLCLYSSKPSETKPCCWSSGWSLPLWFVIWRGVFGILAMLGSYIMCWLYGDV